MNNAKKNALYSLFLIAAVVSVYLYREGKKPSEPIEVKGTTMGTIGYSVKYFDAAERNFGNQVDSLLKVFNQSLSTYIPSSEISRFNQQDTLAFETGFFYPVLYTSKTVYEDTDGAFDPTVGPLVNSWGFGPEDKVEMTQEIVDSLLQLVGFDKIGFNEKEVWKSQKGMGLDFSAIAKGYAIDVIADFLEDEGISNYLVILGGEARCKGERGDGNGWVIGIDNPKYEKPGDQVGVAYLGLKNISVATSGNYRNFYMKEGKRYAHTISPTTGYPVEHSLLSASIFADDCMTADAYATAFMVMGKEKGIELLEGNKKILALLVYEENGKMETYMSEAVKNMIVDLEKL